MMRALLILLLLTTAIGAQSNAYSTYEPSAAYPFGRLNPDAPAETKQFSFLIGEFDCDEEILNPADGKWAKFKAIWNGKYFLNGRAIQDQYWSPAFAASNLRIFDSKSKTWKVSFYKMPNHTPATVWNGTKVGDTMIMRKGKEGAGSRLTFDNISGDGFDWKGEQLSQEKASVFWTSSCKRRR